MIMRLRARLFAERIAFGFVDDGRIVWVWEYRGRFFLADGRLGRWVETEAPD